MDFLGVHELKAGETLTYGKIPALSGARDLQAADVTISIDGDLRFHRYYRWKHNEDQTTGAHHAYDVSDQGVLRVWAVPYSSDDGRVRQSAREVLVRTYAPDSYAWVDGNDRPTPWVQPVQKSDPPAPKQRPGLPTRRPEPPRR